MSTDRDHAGHTHVSDDHSMHQAHGHGHGHGEGEHAGHDKHAGHSVEMFRDRF